MEYRIEHDSMGEVKVPAHRLWGAQTQRSLENFPIGTETMPREILRSFAILKLAAARANHALVPHKITPEKLDALERACLEMLHGELDEHFPLVVWQTGSGTQTNMNVNEVLANRGNAIAGKALLHPNDDVNCSQSSNDTFPTAMHIAAVLALEDALLPEVEGLIACFARLEQETPMWSKVAAPTCRTRCPSASLRKFPAGGGCWKSRRPCFACPCPGFASWRWGPRRWAPGSTPRRALTCAAPGKFPR